MLEDYDEHAPALPELTDKQWAILLDSGCYTQALPEDGGDQSWRAGAEAASAPPLDRDTNATEEEAATAEGAAE